MIRMHSKEKVYFWMKLFTLMLLTGSFFTGQYLNSKISLESTQSNIVESPQDTIIHDSPDQTHSIVPHPSFLDK